MKKSWKKFSLKTDHFNKSTKIQNSRNDLTIIKIKTNNIDFIFVSIYIVKWKKEKRIHRSETILERSLTSRFIGEKQRVYRDAYGHMTNKPFVEAKRYTTALFHRWYCARTRTGCVAILPLTKSRSYYVINGTND